MTTSIASVHHTSPHHGDDTGPVSRQAPPQAPPAPPSAVVAFVRACSSAWLCVRRPAFLLPGFGAVSLFAVLMVIGIFMSAGREGGSRVTDPPTFLPDLALPGALASLAGGIVSITASCVLAVAAAHVAGAFTNGSVRIQLVRQPRRRIWLAGNLAVVALITVALTVVAVLAVVVSAYVAAGIYRVPTDQWATWAAIGPLIKTTVNLSGCMIGFAMLGAAIAVRLRSAIATIGIGLCYGLFEELVAGVFREASRFFPGQNLAALALGGTNYISYPWALVGSFIVITAGVVAALEFLARRDVLD